MIGGGQVRSAALGARAGHDSAPPHAVEDVGEARLVRMARCPSAPLSITSGCGWPCSEAMMICLTDVVDRRVALDHLLERGSRTAPTMP